MISNKEMENMFDSLAKECVNTEELTGGVIMGVFSEDAQVGFHAAHGGLATITALIAAIIERTAENADMSPFELLMLIGAGFEMADDEPIGELN